MNLYLDTCRPAVFAAGWIPGRLLACIDLSQFTSVTDYICKGLHDKARQHYNRAVRLGYRVMVDAYDYRNERIDQIRDINLSMPDRQGRPMDEHYQHPEKFGPIEFCQHHKFVLLLVIDPAGAIVAYMEYYIVGEFSQTSRVLGHAAHLRNGIMPLLFAEAVRICIENGCTIFCYGEWESGTQGLKFFKQSTGFKPMRL